MHTQTQDAPTRQRIFDIVRTELLRIRSAHAPHVHGDIRMDSSLITDLGLDSLSLVEAVVALEQALRIEPLPLAELSESEVDGGRFTVESLVDLCMQRGAA